MVNQDHGNLYDGFARGNTTVLKIQRDQGLPTVKSTITTSPEQNPLVLDIEHATITNPTIDVVQEGTKNVSTLTNLMLPLLQMYSNDSDQDRRYSHAVEELFSLSHDSLSPLKVKPTIILPADKDRIYEEILSRFNIDHLKPQIAISVEASLPGKRYGIQNWAQAMSIITQQFPQYQFNIIYNPAAPMTGYTRVEMENALRAAGILDRTNFVNGSLSELAVLFEQQQLILSNDSGLAHVAGAIENGPRIVTIFLPKDSSTNVWVSSNRQTPVTLLPDRYTQLSPDGGTEQTDEGKKWINEIQPEQVAQKALEALQTTTPSTNEQTPAPAPTSLEAAKESHPAPTGQDEFVRNMREQYVKGVLDIQDSLEKQTGRRLRLSEILTDDLDYYLPETTSFNTAIGGNWVSALRQDLREGTIHSYPSSQGLGNWLVDTFRKIGYTVETQENDGTINITRIVEPSDQRTLDEAFKRMARKRGYTVPD